MQFGFTSFLSTRNMKYIFGRSISDSVSVVASWCVGLYLRVCIWLCTSPFIWWCTVTLIRSFSATVTNHISCFQKSDCISFFFFLCGHSSVLLFSSQKFHVTLHGCSLLFFFLSFPTFHTSSFPSLARFWSPKSETYLRAASIPWASSKAFLKVNSLSDRNLFWMLTPFMPHTILSRCILSKVVPQLQFSDKCFKSTTKSDTVSSVFQNRE